MTDIAQLGLAIDSSQVKTATTSLNSLQTAANSAAAAADKLTSASGKSGTAAKAITTAATPAAVATAALAKASNDAAHAHAGMSTQAMAAFHSVRSMTEGLVLGMPPTQVLTQQLNHLSYAASGPGGLSGAFKEALGSFRSLISPAALVAGGVAAVGAAVVLTVVNLEKMAKQFDDVSRSVGTTTGQMHGLQQAASFKGIGQDEFFKAMEKFGSSVYDAQHNMGSLADVMRANGKSAKDFTGYLEQAADLIKNASSDQQRLQLLQQMGLPITMDWVRFLSQGKDGIRAATNEAAKFNETAEGKLVASARKFDDAWNTATTKMVNTFKAGMADIVTSLASVQVPQWLLNVGRGAAGGIGGGPWGVLFGGAKGAMQGNDAQFGDRFGSFATTGNAGALQQALTNRAAALNGTKKVVDPNDAKNAIAQEQQSIAILGSLASVEDLVRAKQLEINAARLNGIKISKDDADAILIVTRAQAEMSRVQERSAIGVYRLADAQKAMGDQFQSWIDRELLDPKKVDELTAALNYQAKAWEDLSDQSKVAGAALPQLQTALNDATNGRKQLDGLATEAMAVNRGFFTTFGQQLRSGAGAWGAFKTAGLDALGKLSDKLMSMAADNLFANAFGGSSSSGGLMGILGGLLGGGVNANGSIAGAIGPTSVGGAPLVNAFASGTNSAPGGMAIVGEKGPELVNLPRGAQVFSNAQSRGMLSGGTSIQMGDTNINISGNADDYALQQIRAELALHRKAIAAGAANSRSSQRYAQSGVR